MDSDAGSVSLIAIYLDSIPYFYLHLSLFQLINRPTSFICTDLSPFWFSVTSSYSSWLQWFYKKQKSTLPRSERLITSIQWLIYNVHNLKMSIYEKVPHYFVLVCAHGSLVGDGNRLLLGRRIGLHLDSYRHSEYSHRSFRFCYFRLQKANLEIVKK